MRQKLFALFSLIVLFVGGLGYALSRGATSHLSKSDPAAASRALAAAVAQLAVEGLATERWLAARAADPSLREPFGAGTATARSESATKVANKLYEAASKAPELLGNRPALVLLVDSAGVVLGRNGSSMMRGDDLGKVYPALKAALDLGASTSDVWVKRDRNEQLLASFAVVRGEDGKPLGGVVLGSSINDERLSDVSQKTSGQPLALGVAGGGGLDVVAKSGGFEADDMGRLSKGPGGETALRALSGGRVEELPSFDGERSALARSLEGYGDGKQAVIVTIVSPPNAGLSSALLWPALGTTMLGLLLVLLASSIMDSYFSKPLSEIEESLLAIMNGQTANRIELEHAELGGVVFRINSLLNQLFGVAEDDTDEQGRPSRAPDAKGFHEALSVDESIAMSGGSHEESEKIFALDEAEYLRALFDSYVAAKRASGDPTDQLKLADFSSRIRESEAEVGQKHGKPVRFKVEAKGREIVLLAVPKV